ncbi:MAG: ferrous iron transport protein B [Candidatus Aenigmarchaeota archaeon]|nr:ferrous iron transport protein B [Candidatus Aenigmarchaeota archaeon]
MNGKIRIALAGNSNVGKSVIFNYLTGLNQHIGNWPGKTVEKAEGSFRFRGHEISVIDLPGIYSLSTYSIEETVTREYIAKEKPDVVINVVDASVLERNLFFTLQLIEMGRPMIIALNQIDTAEKKGIRIDHKKLGKILGIPVIPTIAVKGTGIYDIAEKAVELSGSGRKPKTIKYGDEFERGIQKIVKALKGFRSDYPPRWLAIKLLENDSEIVRMVLKNAPDAAKEAGKISGEIESIHKHSCPTAVTCEKYAAANRIATQVQKQTKKKGETLAERIHDVSTDKIWGYPVMILIILATFFSVFTFGDFFSAAIEDLLMGFLHLLEAQTGGGIILEFILGLLEGVISAITVILPYILPFYLILGILENSGYLSRMAFLMDNVMHKIGLHGKAFIPLMMGYGCNVPACLGCRIMETHRERMIAIFVTTLIPCAAVTAVILGLVARFVSVWWAIGLYLIDIAIVFALGRIAFRVLPGEPSGLIMEVHSLRMPDIKTTLKQTWFRTKDFVYIALPIIVAGTVLIRIASSAGMLATISELMSPVTVAWLGLPVVTGIALIFGTLKKEMTLVMLAVLFGTTDFASVMTPVQMIVFAFVTMLYIPCAATIAALVRETGWKRGLFITLFNIVFAIVAGGIFFRALSMFM